MKILSFVVCRGESNNPMMKSLRSVALVAIVLVGGSYSYACSCADPSIRQKFRSSGLVFVGTVTDFERAPKNDKEFVYSVRLHVERQWKGTRQKEISVLWAWDIPHMCNDLPLIKGERYLIYTSREDGAYAVYPDCGTNYFAKYQSEEIATLNRRWFRFGARLFPYPRL
jgi:hypothetical protein